MVAERLKESLAMLMIGDGMLALADPHRHMALWRRGPSWWQAMIDPFVNRPELTRLAGVAEALAGYWLASRQKPEDAGA